MALLNFRFNADGLIAKLEKLEREFERAPEILQEANLELARMTAQRALAILEESEIGRPSARRGTLEAALVDPEDYVATTAGFQLGIETFLESRTQREGHQGYWRMIEFTGVQAFTAEATFTQNYDRSGPYTAPGAGSGQPFMPQFGEFLYRGSGNPDDAPRPAWIREVHIAGRAAYHPLARAGASLTKAEIFEIYKAAFARAGISLTGTNLGSRGAYVDESRITA